MILQGGGMRISEIFFDPEPSVGLPSYEFVEWYNSGADTVNLAGWQWAVGDKVKRVASGRIAPGAFAIICSPAAAAAFSTLGPVIAIESFPALKNSGDRLTLLDPTGKVNHTVEYSPDQFTDVLKANGGWSLELTDYSQYCNPMAWVPSVDPSGGTPGRANSQQFTVPPADPPRLIRAAGYDDDRFVLLFSGTLNPEMPVNNYACLINPGTIGVTPVASPEYGFPGLFFMYPGGLDPELTYTVEISGSVNDCAGQEAVLREVPFGYPAQPDSSGVVISEILFDPRSGQTEFVELYNRSAKMVDLKEMVIARADGEGTITGFSDHQDVSYWLFPGSYAVFTPDGKLFGKGWPQADPAVISERADMPSLTNEESLVILLDRSQQVIDVAGYSPGWHYPYLDETKGISLERIDFSLRGTDRSNWFSASAASGGSTPGARNSAEGKSVPLTDQQFTIDPVAGYAATSTDPVQLTVRYRFDDPGWFMKMKVFNNAGMPVKELFPYGTAATEGIVTWDGLDGGQRVVPDGIYLVVADYYHPSGKKGRWKKACAVVRAY